MELGQEALHVLAVCIPEGSVTDLNDVTLQRIVI